MAFQDSYTQGSLEEKYNLGDIETTKEELKQVDGTLTEFAEALEGIETQVDGKIVTWFGDTVPSLINFPASSWTTDEDKDVHSGDLFYDQTTGFAYKFGTVGGPYEWTRETDADIVSALAVANAAQDSADSKRRVFVETPTTPYDVGDVWLKDDSMLYRCQTSKSDEFVYDENDWILGTNYTDDTYAIGVKRNFNEIVSTNKNMLLNSSGLFGLNNWNVYGKEGSSAEDVGIIVFNEDNYTSSSVMSNYRYRDADANSMFSLKAEYVAGAITDRVYVDSDEIEVDANTKLNISLKARAFPTVNTYEGNDFTNEYTISILETDTLGQWEAVTETVLFDESTLAANVYDDYGIKLNTLKTDITTANNTVAVKVKIVCRAYGVLADDFAVLQVGDILITTEDTLLDWGYNPNEEIKSYAAISPAKISIYGLDGNTELTRISQGGVYSKNGVYSEGDINTDEDVNAKGQIVSNESMTIYNKDYSSQLIFKKEDETTTDKGYYFSYDGLTFNLNRFENNAKVDEVLSYEHSNDIMEIYSKLVTYDSIRTNRLNVQQTTPITDFLHTDGSRAGYVGYYGTTMRLSNGLTGKAVRVQDDGLMMYDGAITSDQTTGKYLDDINDTANDDDSWNNKENTSLFLENSNTALAILVGGKSNDRKAMIQVGHSSESYPNYPGTLRLNPKGGDVSANGSKVLTQSNLGGNIVYNSITSMVAGTYSYSENISGANLVQITLRSNSNSSHYTSFFIPHGRPHYDFTCEYFNQKNFYGRSFDTYFQVYTYTGAWHLYSITAFRMIDSEI